MDDRLPSAALGRPAAARRRGAGAGAPAAGAADGRAVRRARRQDPRGTAPHDPPDPARARHDDDPRHARPGRGVRARRPHRRDAPGPPARVRPARRPLHPPADALRLDVPRRGQPAARLPHAGAASASVRSVAARRGRAAGSRRRAAPRGSRTRRRRGGRSAPTSSATARSRKCCSAAPSSACVYAWPSDGPVPVAPGREGSAGSGSLLEVSRTLPEQRDFPVAAGQRVAVGARRVHVLPTPISSFTAVAEPTRRPPGRCAIRRCSRRSARACTRASRRASAGASARRPACRPWRPVPAAPRPREWLLRHGAAQLLCVPPRRAADARASSTRSTPTRAARRVPVAASLLRHVAAEAVYLGIHPAASRRDGAGGVHARPARRALRGARRRTGSTCAPSCASATSPTSCSANSPRTRTRCSCSAPRIPSRIDWNWLGRTARGPARASGADRECGARRPAPEPEPWRATWFRKPSILPGFGLTLGFTTFFLSGIVLLPLAALVFKTAALTWSEFFDDPRSTRAPSRPIGSASARRLLAAIVNAVLRLHRRLVAGALRLPGPPAGRRADRPAVRAADGGVGHRARDRLLADRLARPEAARDRRRAGGLHLARRRRRADPDRPAVRRALGAAGAGRGAARPRGGGRNARRGPVHDLPAHHPAGGVCRRC